MEEWRDVVGYEGYYQVSDSGRVRRAKAYRTTWSGRVLKPKLTSYGYHEVDLSRDNARRTMKIHTLVVEAFIGCVPPGYQVNHKNGNRADNRLSNLEIVTPQQNAMHAAGVLGAYRGKRNGMTKLTAAQVREIRRLYATGNITQTALAERYQVNQGTVWCILQRRTWAWLD